MSSDYKLGSYVVKHDKEIIIFAGRGVWGTTPSKNAIRAITRAIDMVDLQDFSIIADTSEVEGITPDSFKLWREAVENWYQRGHKTLCRVDNPESHNYKVFLRGFDDFARSCQTFSFVNSIQDGVDWLHNEGYKGFEDGAPDLRADSVKWFR